MFDLTNILLPAWARWAALAACGAAAFLLGQLHGERVAGQVHTDYLLAQAHAETRVAKAQIQVLWKTDVQYRDRIQTITEKGKEIEQAVPEYVTPADDARIGVNAGFVRSYNAAWTNEPAAAADESDREPAGVSLADVADADAVNAAACHTWRAEALGLRELYDQMKRISEQAAAAKEPR